MALLLTLKRNVTVPTPVHVDTRCRRAFGLRNRCHCRCRLMKPPSTQAFGGKPLVNVPVTVKTVGPGTNWQSD